MFRIIFHVDIPSIPLKTWRNNYVVITSKRRHFDVITSEWRRVDVITKSLLRNVPAGMQHSQPLWFAIWFVGSYIPQWWVENALNSLHNKHNSDVKMSTMASQIIGGDRWIPRTKGQKRDNVSTHDICIVFLFLFGFFLHYSAVIVSAMASQITGVSTQPFARITENIKAPRHWPLWGESTGIRWITLTKGQ